MCYMLIRLLVILFFRMNELYLVKPKNIDNMVKPDV